MDLPAILARAPELCLIDELAHTNAPGVEHAKRYEDVEDVLAAGIDVLSTLNVQHLESLNDQIAELSGIRVRETIPDAVLGRADEVVIDRPHPRGAARPAARGQGLPGRADRRCAQQLLPDREPRRAARGRAAPGRRGGRAQAPDHASRVGARDETIAAEAPQAVGERLLALVEPYPGAQRLVRRAWRSAQRLGAELDLLWVRPPATALRRAGALADRAAAARLACSARGCSSRSPTTSPQAIADVARQRGTTYILMGRAAPRARPRTPAHPAPAAADGAAARRRRADRRRPRAADRRPTSNERRRSSVGSRSHALRSGSPPASGCRHTAAVRPATARHRCGASCCRSPARRSPVERSRRRSGSPKPRTRRSCPPSLLVCPGTCRSTPRCRRSAQTACRCSRRSSSAPHAQGVAVDARVERGRSYRDALRRLLAAGAVRPRHRLRHRQPAHRPERRRPRAGCSSGCPPRS